MEQLQSIVIFLVLVALAFTPLVWRRAKQADARRKCMTGREVVAYMLYADHCRGDKACLEHYERSARIRAPWLLEADRRMAGWPDH